MMNREVEEIEVSLCGKEARVAIVVSRFNETITEALLNGALYKLKVLGVSSKTITVVRVPGAFEIPGTCRQLIQSKKYDAILTLGAVIRGETPHFDVVVNAVASGVASLSANSDIPVVFGVLTTENVEQAMNRSGLKSGNKGAETAEALVEMINLYKKIK